MIKLILIPLYFASVIAAHIITNRTKELKFKSPKLNLVVVIITGSLAIITLLIDNIQILGFISLIIAYFLGTLQKDLPLTKALIPHSVYLFVLLSILQ